LHYAAARKRIQSRIHSLQLQRLIHYVYTNVCVFATYTCTSLTTLGYNSSNRKRKLSYLKTQFVPGSKHSLSRL
jgi:hypothetical protein